MDYLLRKNNTMFHEKERKIKAILRDDSNNKCVDCNIDKPEYISLNNACFICKNCFKRHQKFPMNVSKTIKNNLRSLTLKELQYLYFGGNKKLLEFMKYEYPKLIKLSPSFAYKTIAMDYYRNWLKYLIEGGTKPQKPDIEIAYKSIEDKEFFNNNYLNNNENNVIEIDFFNDCYNYNNKYNHPITNYINKKERATAPPTADNKDNYNTNYFRNSNISNNSNNSNYNKNRVRYNTDKAFNDKLNPSSNIKDFLTHYKNINKDTYNRYINPQSIDFFSHTQNNFFPKANNLSENYNLNNENIRKKYREKSSEDIIVENNKVYGAQDTLTKNENRNNNNNINENILRAFKTNRQIYIKPKHNIVKSFDKSPILEQRQTKYRFNDKKYNNIEENKDKNDNNNNNNNEMLIKVKRDPNITRKFEMNKKEGRYDSKKNDKEKDYKEKEKEKNNNKTYQYSENNKNFNSENKNNNNNNNKENDENNRDNRDNRDIDGSGSSRISKVNSRIRLTKKKYSYNLNNLNYNLDNKENILNDKDKDKDRTEKETKETKEIKAYKNSKENNTLNVNINTHLRKNMNINDNNNSTINNNNNNNNNNIVFKKKNLKNSFFLNYDKKVKRNNSTIQSQFELISKNINNTTTNDDTHICEESNDDSISVNTARTLTLNKSMKHFYTRYPRKMNKTKTKRRKLNEGKKKEEKKEKEKLKKLRREKSEIIKSLKILLKKKDELNKEKKEESERDEEEEEEENDDNDDNDNENDNGYEDKHKKKRKYFSASKEEEDDYKEKKVKERDDRKYKSTKKKNNVESDGDDNEDEKGYKNNIVSDEKKRKKIYVNQSQELIQKGEKGEGKDSIRSKYKKKNYKYSEI